MYAPACETLPQRRWMGAANGSVANLPANLPAALETVESLTLKWTRYERDVCPDSWVMAWRMGLAGCDLQSFSEGTSCTCADACRSRSRSDSDGHYASVANNQNAPPLADSFEAARAGTGHLAETFPLHIKNGQQ